MPETHLPNGVRLWREAGCPDGPAVVWIYTHVLNRGPTGVTSPADPILGP